MKKGNLYWLVVFMLVLIAGLAVASTFSLPFGYKLLVVQSGSMEPEIKVKSMIFIKREDGYTKGDVVTYKNKEGDQQTTTHRIIEVRDDGFITKGDANNVSDEGVIFKDRIVGKVALSIPFAGYPVTFAKTLPGLIVLIIIPGTIIVYSELLNIKKEVIKFFAKEK